jgi:Flp pilus assembly protein CpaB
LHTHQTRTIALAAGLAVLAVLLTLIYVGSAGAHKATAGPGTTVYVATRDIAAGTPAADVLKAMKTTKVPAASAVGAVITPSQLAGLVAVEPVYRGEIVSLRRFAVLRDQGVVADLHGRLRAVVVSGDATQLLAGSLHDGDHVDVVASLKDPQSGHPYVRTVLRNVVVLSAAGGSGGGITGGSASYTATVRVNDAQAQTLFYVVKNADWAFELRPVVHPGDTGAGTTSFATLMAGQQ